MVQDSGGVPLSVKGVVIGLNGNSMDVVWDVHFMSGVTLGDRYGLSSNLLTQFKIYIEYRIRCSQYRGSTVEFNSCLNLTNPQFVASTNPQAPTTSVPDSPFKPRSGPYPVVQPAPGQSPASGFRPAYGRYVLRRILAHFPSLLHSHSPVHIMNNPNRARGGFTNGRGAGPHHNQAQPQLQTSGSGVDGESPSFQTNGIPRGIVRTRGGLPSRARGRGFAPHFDRGRVTPHRGFRGRGRGAVAAQLPS